MMGVSVSFCVSVIVVASVAVVVTIVGIAGDVVVVALKELPLLLVLLFKLPL